MATVALNVERFSVTNALLSSKLTIRPESFNVYAYVLMQSAWI
jgi:hypothetical protein